MSERAISDPSQHGWVEVDGKWMWDSSGGSGGGESYDDTEVRGLIATNASAISINGSAISANSDRIDALESGGGSGGGDSLWTDNGDGSISYSGRAFATDFIAE
ncbi:hypothetical protein [uncultured Mediterranean phage uvMED]|nr:hypothetical protein [uncultured phage MedDCM-OCT-S01-C1]BAQ84695.1 hypothetical protein [uncultured Mediterranean phage uvMED]